MSVYRRFTGHDVPSLITTNVASHEPLFADPSAAEALILAMEHAKAELRATVYAYVVMPNHLHLVVAPNEHTTHGQFVRLMKGRFAHRWNRTHSRRGAIWQPRFHERALRSEEAVLAAIDYVHNNPVAAGLVEEADEYPWSSVREYILLPHVRGSGLVARAEADALPLPLTLDGRRLVAKEPDPRQIEPR